MTRIVWAPPVDTGSAGSDILQGLTQLHVDLSCDLCRERQLDGSLEPDLTSSINSSVVDGDVVLFWLR
jgi:hypothetical protein